jgi:competence ComEA-like helix-hairpin-helix protein
MNSRKFRSRLTNAQQNGVFLFIGLVVIVLISVGYYNYQYPKLNHDFSVVDTLLQKKFDSLKRVSAEAKETYTPKIYPFNPNFLKEGKAYRLGLSAEEHTRLLDYRADGKWINSDKDFQKVTQVSDEILNKISPYFKFPDWVVEQQKQKTNISIAKVILNFEDKQDLNSVTIEELQKINGVGEVLSQRIIRYRNKIGKFRSDIQLKDVYGLKPNVIEKITAEITVKTNLDQSKININTASLIELAEVPYFDYELAREIYQYIKVNEGISNFEELSKLQQFPTYKIERIKLYLALNE